MTGPARRPQRVRMPYIERLAQSLSERDWAIIETLDHVRLASGLQLERLHFHQLADHSRQVKRGQVLKRLVDARVLLPCERRVGAARHGSDQLCYVLDSAGRRLLQLRANQDAPERRVRRPRQPGERFISHAVAVTELYVALVEHSRVGRFIVEAFDAEPACWWPNGLGGLLKPDAYVKLRVGTVTDYWWYEADLGNEVLPTIRGQLRVYLDFVARGQLGPDDIVPRVAVGVPTPARRSAVQREINQLPEPANVMFQVWLLPDVPAALIEELTN
jgi:hypothetical protein